MKVYKVTADGTWCAYDNLARAVEFMAVEIETEAESLEQGQTTMNYCIEVCEMTEEEYANLPEFNGF